MFARGCALTRRDRHSREGQDRDKKERHGNDRFQEGQAIMVCHVTHADIQGVPTFTRPVMPIVIFFSPETLKTLIVARLEAVPLG